MRRIALLILAFFALLLAALPSTRAQQIINGNQQFFPLIPCVQLSAGNPYNPVYPTATCQPTAGAFQVQSPTPAASASPTLGPILPSPVSLSFANPASAPQSITVTESNYTGTWGVSFDTQSVASVSSVVGNQIFFIPAAGNLGGNSTNATIFDSVGNTSPPIPITVGTAPPTAGPVVFVPSSLTPFLPAATPTTVALSETNYAGGFTATAAPNGCVGASVVSTTLTVSVLGSGCAATITVTGGQQGQLAASVGATPTPPPTPNYFNATPYNGFPAGPNPSPVAATFPQNSTLTVAATVKCVAQTSTGLAIAGFLNAWSLEAGLCSGTGVANLGNQNGLHFFDALTGNQAVPANGIAPATTYFIAGLQNGAGISIYVCPQAASPAWTCNAPTTVAYTGTIATGTNPGYIGIAADGLSRQFDGDIWDFGIYPQMTGTQVQALAFTSRSDPYPSPLPGPLVASPAPLPPLPAPTSTQAYSVTDPNYSGALIASPVPAACFSASITGTGPTWTGVITGNGTTGNCSLSLSDSGYNSTMLPVQISPTPPSVPAPVYTNAVPNTPYPVSLPTFPSSANMTIIASINCLAVNTTGAAIFATAATMSLQAGLCNSAALDPPGGTGAHGYSATGSKQAQLTTPNAINGVAIGNGLPLGQYTVGMSIDGVNVNAFLCPLPYVANGCIENSVSDNPDAWTVGNIQAYIGVASNGTSRNANGLVDVWGIKAYATALPLVQVQAVAATQTTDPYPTPAASQSPVIAGYASPIPAWVNNIGFTTKINDTPAKVFNANNNLLRGWNAAAWSLYLGMAGAQNRNGSCTGCEIGWDQSASSIGPYPGVIGGGSTRGMEIFYAKSTDPTFQLYCAQYCGAPTAGVDGGQSGGYCSSAGCKALGTSRFSIYIPAGAQPQNSGLCSGCDKHLIVIEPLQWNGSGALPTLPAGGQYEFDIEDFTVSTTSAAAALACTSSSASCTTVGSANGYAVGLGVGIQTTTGSGWNRSTSPYDGYYPGVTSIKGNSGPGFAGKGALTAFAITANDAKFAYANGYVPHAIGIAAECLRQTQSDAYPSPSIAANDTRCDTNGTTGFAYTDWLMFNRTFANTCNDPWKLPCASTSGVGTGTLKLFQAIVVNTCNTYGCFFMDTIGSQCCGVFYFRIAGGGGPAWGPSKTSGTIQNLYGTTYMPTDSNTGLVTVNANFPLSYGQTYGASVLPCVKANTC